MVQMRSFPQSCLIIHKTMQAWTKSHQSDIWQIIHITIATAEIQWNLRSIRDAFSPHCYSIKISFPQSVRICWITCVKDDNNKRCGSRVPCSKFINSGPWFTCTLPPSVRMSRATPASVHLNNVASPVDSLSLAKSTFAAICVSTPFFTLYISAHRNNAFTHHCEGRKYSDQSHYLTSGFHRQHEPHLTSNKTNARMHRLLLKMVSGVNSSLIELCYG